jgi:hypothetical protein
LPAAVLVPSPGASVVKFSLLAKLALSSHQNLRAFPSRRMDLPAQAVNGRGFDSGLCGIVGSS